MQLSRHPENLPILYRNVIDALPDDGIAVDAFLWAAERPGEDRMCYRAEAFAREVATLCAALGQLLDARDIATFRTGGRLLAPDQREDLRGFILTRHANWRTGGNVHPPYAEACHAA